MSADKQKELFKLLNEESARQNKEIDLIIDVLDLFSKNKNSTTAVAVNQLRQAIHSGRNKDTTVAAYFSGNGPIAKRIKEHALLTEYLRFNLEIPVVSDVASALWRFDYLSGVKTEDLSILQQFLNEKIEPWVYADDVPFPIAKQKGDFDTSADTGFYLMESPSGEVRNAMILNGALPHYIDLNVRCLFVAIAGVQPKLLYHHPEEGHWILSDYSCILPSTVKCLEIELTRAIVRHQKAREPRDWVTELTVLEEKVNLIFEQEQFLPENFQAYRREGTISQIELGLDNYAFVFRNSHGHYPIRSYSILQRAGAITHAIKVTDIPEDELRKIFYFSERELMDLQNKINERLQSTAVVSKLN